MSDIRDEWVEKAASAYFESAPEGCAGYEFVSDHIKDRARPRFASAIAAVADDIRAQERDRIAVAIEAHARDGADYGAAWQNNRGYYSGLMGAAELARAEEVGK